MEEFTFNSSVIAFWIFISLLLAIFFLYMFRSTPGLITTLRLLGTIPFGIYAGLSVQLLHDHYDADGQLLSKSGAIWMSQSIHAVAGILLTIWSFVSAFCSSRLNQTDRQGRALYSDRWRGLVYFCIIIMDLLFIAVIAAATALAPSFIPWKSNDCNTYNIYPSPKPNGRSARIDCHQSWTIRLMAIAILCTLGVEIISIRPNVVIPHHLRIPIIHIMRLFHLYKPPVKPIDMWKDIEKAIDRESEKSQAPSLGSVFRDDRIAGQIASHLHFDDLSNVSMASKAMRVSVFRSPTGNRSDRYELLCESACENGTKAECWVCTKVICKNCKIRKHTIKAPRTRDHLHTCHVLCNACYFFRQSTQFAPLAASINPSDLSAQHRSCPGSSLTSVLYPSLGEIVDLCSTCAWMTHEKIKEARETREAEELRKMLSRRVRCFVCEKALKKGRRRWWVCELGKHDCRWEGHEVEWEKLL